jgi:hypothetical protein
MQEKPDLVLLSKPDIFDKSGTIRKYLDDHDFDLALELLAFQVFRPVNEE